MNKLRRHSANLLFASASYFTQAARLADNLAFKLLPKRSVGERSNASLDRQAS